MDCGEVGWGHIGILDVFLPSLNSVRAEIIYASQAQGDGFDLVLKG